MKFVLAFVAILATANCQWQIPNLGRGQLHKDLQAFVDLIPTDKFVKIVMQYVAEDNEVQRGLEYMQSKDFRELVEEVNAMPEYIEGLDYLQNAGVDIYYIVNRFLEYIHVPTLRPPGYYEYAITGGFKGLVDDLKKLIPDDQVKALYREKLQTSPAFKELYDRLHTPEFAKVIKTIYANPRFTYILNKAKGYGINVIYVRDLLCRLGVAFPGCQL